MRSHIHICELQFLSPWIELFIYINNNAILSHATWSSFRYKILRRRVIWMVGQWINVKCARQTRTVLYPVLLDLMNVQEDLVVSPGLFFEELIQIYL